MWIDAAWCPPPKCMFPFRSPMRSLWEHAVNRAGKSGSDKLSNPPFVTLPALSCGEWRTSHYLEQRLLADASGCERPLVEERVRVITRQVSPLYTKV